MNSLRGGFAQSYSMTAQRAAAIYSCAVIGCAVGA